MTALDQAKETLNRESVRAPMGAVQRVALWTAIALVEAILEVGADIARSIRNSR